MGSTSQRATGEAPAAHPDRDVRLLFAVGGAAAASFLPFWVLLLDGRGLGPEQIGLVLSISALAGVLAIPVWSDVADTRLGTVWTLQVSNLASAAAALALIPTGSSFLAIAAVAAVLAVASAPGTALSDTIALGHLGPERMTRYGTIRLWASLGWAVAVLLFGALYERVGLGPMLPLYAAGSLAYAVVTARFPATRPVRGRARASRFGAVGEAFRSSPRLLPFLVGLLVVSTATYAAFSFVPLRIVSQGGGPFLIGLSACLGALVEIPFFRSSAWLGEHVGLRALYVTGVGIYVVMIAAWAVLENPTFVALVKVAGGAAFGLIYAALVVITGRLVPERLRNTGQALMQVFAAGIGPIVGAAIGGFVYRHLGASTLFAWSAAFTAIGAAIVWLSLSGGAFSRAPRATGAAEVSAR